MLHQALEGLTKTGDERCAVRTLAAMGTTLIQTGEEEQAGPILRETLSRAIDVDDLQSIRAAVVGTAQLFQTHGRTVDAVRLYAFVNSLAHKGGLPLTPTRQQRRSDLLTALRSHLDPDDFSLAWSEGEAMTLEDARSVVTAR